MKYSRLLVFLVLNFGALALGGWSTGSAVVGDWYLDLNKAPWTPPGWVFGAAWSFVMTCFAIFMAYAYETTYNRKGLIGLYVLQWVLNVLWNPIFFTYHLIGEGAITIILLGLVQFYLLISNHEHMGKKSLWIFPYLMWLTIAISLNIYIYLEN